MEERLKQLQRILRILLGGITLFYLAAVIFVLPFYYKTATSYSWIATDKELFFQRWGFRAAKLFLPFAACYLCTVLINWWLLHSKEKGKLSLLINDMLDGLSLTDKFACIYIIALWFSYYYSDYKHIAILGRSGWMLGFWQLLVMAGSYFAVSRLFSPRLCKCVAGALLASSFCIFLLGILNRYGFNPLGMESSGSGFISTIGNINWYCGYAAVCFPLGAGLFLLWERADEPKGRDLLLRIGLGIYTAVGFVTTVTQGSDSGFLMLAGLLLVGGCLAVQKKEWVGRYLKLLLLCTCMTIFLSLIQQWFPEQNTYPSASYLFLTETPFPYFVLGVLILFCVFWYRYGKSESALRLVKRLWWGGMALLGMGLICTVALIVVNTLHPGSIGELSRYALFTFDQKWGSSRGGTWVIGLRVWLSQNSLHKLVGVGPDCMSAFLYSGDDQAALELAYAQFGEYSRLTNAHNEWITVLVNLGVFGLIGFGGIIISAIVRFFKSRGVHVLCAACGIAVFCYTLHNIFSFWQVMNITYIFIVMGIGEGILRRRT